MATLTQIIGMLNEQRRSLLDQLDAVDRAIAALAGAGTTAAGPAPAPTVVLSRQVAPRRALTDSHKQALLAGRRKARNVKDVAAGHAREMPDESFVPAIGTRSDRQTPRLVKQPASSTPGR